MVQWFNVKAKTGIASLYSSSINLNTTAMYPFESAYMIQVGIGELVVLLIGLPIYKKIKVVIDKRLAQ